MDRSNVRDTAMNRSYVFNNTGSNMNRSFISTALIGDSFAFNDDLRKSRIQNLPNYKKRDLSECPQFIIVFQAIEIERLSAEVQVLRMKLTQIGRQLFNAQNYEVQIKQLNQKCFTLQKLRVEYTDQIQKLGKICQTLYHENQSLKTKLSEMDYSLKQKFQAEVQRNNQLSQQLQKWKARYQATEKSKAKQLDDLRNMMESQRKSMIDRQIKQATIRFQNQRSGLENEIRKGREGLENRNRQVDDLRQKCKKFEITISQLKNYQNVIADNQNKIVLLNQQLMRLRQVLTKKDIQLQEIRQKQFKLTQQLKAQQNWQSENKQLKNALDNRTREIQQWKVRNSRLQDEVVKGRQMIHYNQELSDKLNFTGKEIQRLNNMLRTKLDQIEDFKGKLTRKDQQIGKLKNLENQKASYQNRSNMLQAQNDRINGILKTRLTQIEDWKGKYSKLQGTLNNYANLDREKKNLEDKLNNQIRNNEQLQFNIKKVEKDASTYRGFENQFKQADRQNGIMSKQIQRLNGLIRNYSNQIDDYRTRLGKMQKALSDYRNVELQMKDQANRINAMIQEKQRLNGLLKSKNDDIQNLENEKLKLHNQITHYKNYQIKISEADQTVARQKQDINKLRRDIQNWQGRAKEAENKTRQLDNALFQNNSQKQKLSSMVKAKNNEYENLRNQYSRLEGDNRRISQLQSTLKQQHRQIQAYASDLEQQIRATQSLQAEYQKQKNVCNQFAYKIIVLSCELERMAVSGASKSAVNTRQFQQLQQDYSRLQSKVTSKNNQIDILMTRISGLEQKVQSLTQDFRRLYQQVMRSQQETEMFNKKVDEYQDYAKRIHILGAEIDRLRAENKAYDEDARRMRLRYADGLAIDKKIQDFNLITVLMGVQIDGLRARVDQRQINIDQMRKSILDPIRNVP